VNRLALAQRVAAALDADDLPATAALLDPAVVYGIGDRVLRGPDAVCASYAESAAWGAANLDQVTYDSAVSLAPDGTAVLAFVDHLRVGEHRHTYRCEQVLGFTDSPPLRVATLTHRELPGEREALLAWFATVGVTPR